jgi:hypothetical protein
MLHRGTLAGARLQARSAGRVCPRRARAERMRAGGRAVEVTGVQITDAGRRALDVES